MNLEALRGTHVTVVEVGPRDGLQSLPTTYPLETKVAMVESLAQAGLQKIEVTGFVRPDVVPQLSDAADLLARLTRFPGCIYRALVPNRKGAERAAAAGVDELLGLISASEAYGVKNQGMNMERALDEIAEVARVAQASRLSLVVAISMSMYCPDEGDIPPGRILEMIERMRSDGVDSFYVATTAGLDGPRAVHDLCARILDRWPDVSLAVHLHDTNGMALANALAAMDAGVRVFEGSICGIGGGIYVPKGMPPHGNVATEDLVNMCFEAGIDTGIDLEHLLRAAREIRDLLDLDASFSHALQGGTKAEVRRRAESAVETSGN
jgi:hydroxymethylglutaryl-CoA lyase